MFFMLSLNKNTKLLLCALMLFIFFLFPQKAVCLTFQVNSLLDETSAFKNACITASGKCSLRAAIDVANTLQGSSIELMPGLYELELGQLEIKADMDIFVAQKHFPLKAIMSTQTNTRLVHIQKGNVSFHNIVFQNGSAVNGGCLLAEKDSFLSLQGTEFFKCSGKNGTAMLSEGTLDVRTSIFHKNSGDFIVQTSSSLPSTFINCIFRDNKAEGSLFSNTPRTLKKLRDSINEVIIKSNLIENNDAHFIVLSHVQTQYDLTNSTIANNTIKNYMFMMDGTQIKGFHNLFLSNSMESFSKNTSGSKSASASVGFGNSIFKDNTINDLSAAPFFTSFGGNLLLSGSPEVVDGLKDSDTVAQDFALIVPDWGDDHNRKTFFFEPFQWILKDRVQFKGELSTCSSTGFRDKWSPLNQKQNLFLDCAPGPRPVKHLR